MGDWLAHREDAGFEKYGDDTNRVRTRHRWVFRRLQNYEPHIGFRIARLKDDIRVVPGRAPRLKQQNFSNLIQVLFQMQSLVEPRLARHRPDSADHNLPALPFAMAIHDIQGSTPAH